MNTCALTILGCNSALAEHGRNPTAQVLQMRNHTFLIDCGEGTQMRIQQYNVKWFNIDHIFISHLHGDHYYGLIGLLTTFNLLKRQADLTLYAPKELKAIIDIQLAASNTKLNYNLHYIETHSETPQLIFEDDTLTVHTIPLQHKIPTNGFLFREKIGDRKLLIEKLEGRNYQLTDLKLLKRNTDILDDDGNPIFAREVTTDPNPAKSYAFCSDTMYNEAMFDQIRGVDLLYHESTFLHDSLQRAEETKHSTALQAGLTAKEAQVKQLLIGHYSSRYANLTPLLEEAQTAFGNTILAVEGQTYQF